MEIKQCPKCGSTKLKVYNVSSDYRFGHVDCQCGISFSFRRKEWEETDTEWYDYCDAWQNDTITAWNIRNDDLAKSRERE